VRRLLLAAAVLLAIVLLFLVVDVVAKGFVEGRVEDEFVDSDQIEVQDASFSIDSFPFLWDLFVASKLSATLELEGIEEQGLTIDRFEMSVDDLTFDRASAFAGDVEVTGVGEVTASMELGASAISDLVGLPVEIRSDGTVLVDGSPAEVTLDGSSMTVQGVTVDLSLRRYFPCTPDVAVRDDLVELSCTTDRLPRIVNRIIGEVANRA
jgi:hypothetical protein